MSGKQSLTRGIRRLLVILSIGTLWGLAATAMLIWESSPHIPSTQTANPLAIDALFVSAQCPPHAQVSEGPTWRNITIGLSDSWPISELYGIQFTFQGPPVWANEGFARGYDILLTRERAEELGLPMGINFCVVDHRIAALSTGLPQDGSFPLGSITEWVAQYGVPEIVAWIEGTSDWCNRTLVWPSYGLAVEFNVTLNKIDQEIAWAHTITLLPYAKDTESVNSWPYNDFLDNKPPSGENIDNCPTEQNPFTFNGLPVNQTAQPNR